MSEIFDGTMPTRPPLEELPAGSIVPGVSVFDQDAHPDWGAVAPEAASGAPVVAVTERSGLWEVVRNHKTAAKVASVVAGATLVIGGVATSCSGGGENGHRSGDKTEQVADAPKIKVCPEGVFPRGLFESNKDISTAGDLHRQPESELKTKTELSEYLFGENGVACESATSLAVIKTGVLSMIGEGAAKARGFDIAGNFDQQIDIYKKNHEAALSDAQKLNDIVSKLAKQNDSKIAGAYQKVVGVVKGDEVLAAFEKKDVEFNAKAVWLVTGVDANGDAGENGGNYNQIMVIDKETGQVYFLQSIGLPQKQPNQKPTAVNKKKGKSGGSSAPSGGKAPGKVREQNSGPQNNNNNVGPAPEAANNDNDNTPAGGGGGGGETPGTTPGTRPPETQPPQTVPPTRPPQTVPPTTRPPQTVPPTTLPPKGTNPGCPPEAPCN